MSYQEIKRISRGRKWMVVTLVIVSVFVVFLKKTARAQNTFDISGSAEKTQSDWTCTHSPYTVTYTFENYFNRGGKVPLEGALVSKCTPAIAELKTSGIWAGRLAYVGPRTCADLGLDDYTLDCTPDPLIGWCIPYMQCSPGKFVSYISGIDDYCCVSTAACGTGGVPCSTGPCGACACCACSACSACSACGPPADVIDCDSMDNCLSQGNLYDLDSEGRGKGVVQNPIFADLTPAGANAQYLSCAGHQCKATSSGRMEFQEKVNATKYYGQCVNAGVDIKLEGAVAEVKNTVNFFVSNTEPMVTNLAAVKNPISPEQKTEITCEVSDPDCQNDPDFRELARVTWDCKDKNGKSVGCYFEKDGDTQEGKLVENLNMAGNEEYANPYRSTVKFLAHNYGDYNVTCKVEDSDANNPKSKTKTIIVNVNEQAAQDAPYCTILNVYNSGEEGAGKRTICVSNETSLATVKHKAYLLNANPEKYYWKCDKNGNNPPVESSSNIQSCDYGVRADAYYPSLSLKLPGSDELFPCAEGANTQVTCTQLCSVKVRPWGSGKDPVSSVSLSKGNDVEAVIDQQCMRGGDLDWNVVNSKINSSALYDGFPSGKLRIETGDALQSKIGATITVTKNGVQNVKPCNEATVDVKEKVEWRR